MGGRARQPGRAAARRGPEGGVLPEQAPHLTGVRLPAWSAAYRRAFLTERELWFPAGHFTDVGFGGLVAAGAARMAVLRSVLVRHLVRRQGNRLNLPGDHHTDLLDQADLVLTRVAEADLSPSAARPCSTTCSRRS